MNHKTLIIILIILSIPPSITSHNITIYSIEGCHACEDTINTLQKNKIPFNLIKINNNKTALEELTKLYKKANITEKMRFPTTIINNKYLIIGSFTPTTIKIIQNNQLDTYGRAIKLPTPNTTTIKNNTPTITTTTTNNSTTNHKQYPTKPQNQNETLTPLYTIALANILNPSNIALYLYYLSTLTITTNTKKTLTKNTLLFIIGAFTTYTILGISLLNIPITLKNTLLQIFGILLTLIGSVRIFEGIKN